MNAKDLLESLETRPRVYIAGPMRGLPQLNSPAFYDAEKRWRGWGWLTVNPARLDHKASDMTFEACMRRDIRKLSDCDAVALLPGWQASEGANWEVAAGTLIGCRFFDAETGGQIKGPVVGLTIDGVRTKRFLGEVHA